jgi:DNA polymerase I-like protein with 3'-5' exonuclease and polymerase domains
LETVEALACLTEFASVEKLRGNYLVPMQYAAWPDGRLRSWLNLNTETGRLSSRTPNLQNQPALDKDRSELDFMQQKMIANTFFDFIALAKNKQTKSVLMPWPL